MTAETPDRAADRGISGSPLSDSSDSGPIGPQLHRALGLAANPDSIDELDEILPATRAALHAEGLRQIVRVAAGACGVVCRATDMATSNLRAVKILLDLHNSDARRMFQRECRILDAPELPPGLVPRFYRAIEPPEGQPFLILEWIDGETLGDYLAARPALSIPDRELLCLTVCRAYAQLHAAHLLQRDPSLNNILVGSSGRIRLIDFGGGGRPNPGYRSLQTLPAVPVTHAFASDAVRSGDRRPTAADEVHAVARICFTILSGKIGSQHPPAELPKLLAAAQIPDDVSSIILEYSSQPPAEAGTAGEASEHWSAATLAGRIDAALDARRTQQQRQQQLRSRRTSRAALLFLVITLCLLAASHLVLNSSISSQQQQRSLILEQVNALGADVESFQLRPSPPLPLLNQRLDRLRQLNSQLQAELETLSIPELQQRSDRLLRGLLDLHHNHAAALGCEEQFRRWRLLASAVSEGIRDSAEFAGIRDVANLAATASNSGDWESAARRFGEAAAQLEELLRKSGADQIVTPLSPKPQFELVFTQQSLAPREVARIQQSLAESLSTTITTQNSIGMTLLLIPAGEFLQGSPVTEPGRKAAFGALDPEKQRLVRISRPFRMAATEVTQSQWQAVMSNNPSTYKGENRPVENVSWEDVQTFIRRLNQRGEGQYRLPTEAEWEYAARAGTTTPWACGSQKTCLSEVAWYERNADKQTHPVAQKQPNAWGLYDMHGNVFEWVQDWYGSYPDGDVTDPGGPSSGSSRGYRGGAWDYGMRFVRSAYRSFADPTSRYAYLGFRLVRLP